MAAVDLEVIRARMSHLIRECRRERERPSMKVTLPFLDLQLGDDYTIEHPAGPALPRDAGYATADVYPGLYGWGPEDWLARLVRLRGRSIHLNEGDAGVTLHGQTRNGFLCTYWNTLESERSSNVNMDGIARLGQGGAETFTRATPAWITDPGSNLVVMIGAGVPPIAKSGTHCENFKNNFLARSSFASGGAGFAAASGTGTVTFETPPPQPLFDTSVSAYCMKHTAGNPHTVNLVQAWPITGSLSTGQNYCFSVDHMDDAGANYRWALSRAVDGRFWNDLTLTWDVGSVYNQFNASTTRVRDRSRPINIGGTPTAVTLFILQLAGGAALRVNRTYHVQLEQLDYPTSRIVTDAFPGVARNATIYTVASAAGARVWNANRGSGMCRVRTTWNGADMLNSGFPAIFINQADGNNFWWLYYNGPAQRLDFVCRVAGVQFQAVKAWVPVADVEYQIGWRWASAESEHNLPPRQLSLFIDGVRSTSEAARSGNPTEAATLNIGGDAIGNAWNGTIRRFLLTQEVYSDLQMAAGIA